MAVTAGLWIDHKKAVIVTLSGKDEVIKKIPSDIGKLPWKEKGRGSSASSSQAILADDRLLRRLTRHLNVYYDQVSDYLAPAESVLIFGPGEAKGELKKRLERPGHRGRVVAVETADKMTERQISANVRRFFSRRGAASRASAARP